MNTNEAVQKNSHWNIYRFTDSSLSYVAKKIEFASVSSHYAAASQKAPDNR